MSILARYNLGLRECLWEPAYMPPDWADFAHSATEDSNEAQLVVQEWCRSATVLPALHPNEGSLLVSASQRPGWCRRMGSEMVTAPATARGRHDLTSSERRNQKSASRGQTVLAVAVPRKEKVAFVMHLSRMVLQFGGRQASIIPFGGSEGAKQSKKRRASESEVTFSAE